MVRVLAVVLMLAWFRRGSLCSASRDLGESAVAVVGL